MTTFGRLPGIAFTEQILRPEWAAKLREAYQQYVENQISRIELIEIFDAIWIANNSAELKVMP